MYVDDALTEIRAVAAMIVRDSVGAGQEDRPAGGPGQFTNERRLLPLLLPKIDGL